MTAGAGSPLLAISAVSHAGSGSPESASARTRRARRGPGPERTRSKETWLNFARGAGEGRSRRVARRERGVPALGRLRRETAAHAHEVRLPEARARGDEGGVALGILGARVHDGEVGRPEARRGRARSREGRSRAPRRRARAARRERPHPRPRAGSWPRSARRARGRRRRSRRRERAGPRETSRRAPRVPGTSRLRNFLSSFRTSLPDSISKSARRTFVPPMSPARIIGLKATRPSGRGRFFDRARARGVREDRQRSIGVEARGRQRLVAREDAGEGLGLVLPRDQKRHVARARSEGAA